MYNKWERADKHIANNRFSQDTLLYENLLAAFVQVETYAKDIIKK